MAGRLFAFALAVLCAVPQEALAAVLAAQSAVGQAPIAPAAPLILPGAAALAPSLMPSAGGVGLSSTLPGLKTGLSPSVLPSAVQTLKPVPAAAPREAVRAQVQETSKGVAEAIESLGSETATDQDSRQTGERVEELLTGEKTRSADPVAVPDAPGSVPPQAGLARPAGALGLVREMAFGEKAFAPMVAPLRGRMNRARALLILKAVLSTGMAYSVGALVDAAIAHSLPGAVLWLAALTGLTAAKAVQQKLYATTTGGLRLALRRDFRVKLFEKLLRMSPEALKGEKPHDIAARLTRDAAQVTIKNVYIPIQFPQLLIQLGLGAGFVVATSWQLALVVLASIPILTYLSYRYGRRISVLQEEASSRQARMTRVAGELLEQVGGMDEERRLESSDKYRKTVKKNEETLLEIVRVSSSFDSLQEFLQGFFAEALVLGLGLFGFLAFGVPSVGQVMALRGYAKDLRGAVDGMLGLYTDGKDAEGATRRVMELFNAPEPARP